MHASSGRGAPFAEVVELAPDAALAALFERRKAALAREGLAATAVAFHGKTRGAAELRIAFGRLTTPRISIANSFRIWQITGKFVLGIFCDSAASNET